MNSVSVIIPTWNRSETIEKAILSALKQTMPPLEVIVCDDGSTDNTEHLVRSIKDNRLRWLSGAHGGRPAIPRNRGISVSRGEWLAFLDSDDEWMEKKLHKQLSLAKSKRLKAVSSNAYRFTPEKGMQGHLLKWKKEKITFDDLLRVNKVICSSVLIHRSCFDQAIGFPETPTLKAIEDYALWLRVATITDFAFSREPLVVYRDSPVSSARCDDNDLIWQRRQVFEDFLKWGKDHHVDDILLSKAQKNYHHSLSGSQISALGTIISFFKNQIWRKISQL